MISVIGAGMAGLLAAAMLRNECSGVYERQVKIPRNHSAVLRFRTNMVGEALNIPFRQVKVLKAIEHWRNPIADALSYSRKTNGSMTLRSILSADDQIVSRFIAPEDLIDRMISCVQCQIFLGLEISNDELLDASSKKISTMPMPALMEILGWKPVRRFEHASGTNVTFRVTDLDAHCSLYVPSDEFEGSRISINGSQVIVECPQDLTCSAKTIALEAAERLGISRNAVWDIEEKKQKFSKILPYDERDRKNFIVWATEKHGIYSLGRFATWRPGLLMDDVVNDVRVIHRLAQGESSYDLKK
jgi:hypothetical protein